ncbi:DUF2283 domain-containing protein [Methanobrevibacter sp. OttesenSCG-928-K11]|nr:DUF2283 domain-containing protein [Methanobrevibacter sp. OttesenSCG-928-K11]
MIKNVKISQEYDYEYDIFDIDVEKDYKYDISVKLDEGLILDFDKNNVPVSLEIMDASKITNIDKKHLKNADVEVHILIKDNIIAVIIKFTYSIHIKSIDVSIEKDVINKYNIPEINAILAST